MRRKNWLVLAGFAVLALFLRFSTFPRSVIDWDESVYLLMGRSLLRGEVPYAAVWEHSPLGTAVLFALAHVVFGKSVVVIRIVTWLAVTVTAFALYRVGNLLGRRSAGWIAGLMYAVSSVNLGGLAAHRELLFAPFITVALYLILSCKASEERPPRKTSLNLLLAGLLMGCGLQIKYLYALDVAAMWLIATFVLWPHRPVTLGEFAGRTLKHYALLAVGPLLFVGLTAGYSALKGSFTEYMLANFIAGAAYVATGEFSPARLVRRLVGQATGNPLLWLSLALTPVYLVWAREVTRRERRTFLFVLLWFAAAFAGTLISGRLWAHYFLQLLPSMCLLAGLLTAGVLRAEPNWDPIKRGIALTLLVVTPLVPIGYAEGITSAGMLYNHFVRAAAWPADGPTQIAAYLRERVQPDESIYVADYQPILYYLVPARMPTRYVFPPHLIDVQFQDVDQVRPVEELDRIMSQRPRYVIRTTIPDQTISNTAFREALSRYLAEAYTLEKTFQTTDVSGAPPLSVELYRLRH